MHAPSLGHAATAAVLRSGFLAHRGARRSLLLGKTRAVRLHLRETLFPRGEGRPRPPLTFAAQLPSAGGLTVAAMTRAVATIAEATHLPIGVNVLRNDALAALAIATFAGAVLLGPGAGARTRGRAGHRRHGERRGGPKAHQDEPPPRRRGPPARCRRAPPG